MRLMLALLLACAFTGVAADPLPSWNDGPAKQAIVAFVADVTDASGADFVPPAQRVAVFDNDGTLWVEQPMYTQLAFVLDRVKGSPHSTRNGRTSRPSRQCCRETWRHWGRPGWRDSCRSWSLPTPE